MFHQFMMPAFLIFHVGFKESKVKWLWPVWQHLTTMRLVIWNERTANRCDRMLQPNWNNGVPFKFLSCSIFVCSRKLWRKKSFVTFSTELENLPIVVGDTYLLLIANRLPTIYNIFNSYMVINKYLIVYSSYNREDPITA